MSADQKDQAEKSKGGRPTKLTPEVEAKLCEAIRLGMPYDMSAYYARIQPETLRNWIRRGETGEEPFAGFLGALKEAESDGLAGWLRTIEDASSGKSEGQWQAAAWKAERRYPHVYGRTVHEQVHSGTVKTVRVEGIEKLSVEQMREMLGGDGEK